MNRKSEPRKSTRALPSVCVQMAFVNYVEGNRPKMTPAKESFVATHACVCISNGWQ